ncbi:flagellar export chaperone FliS [Limnochorda pilosa]|uniref:Flagellar secretion chaperone FliS n=1 Tax=Limnochorda pilosa TaxID=1555112 RepID=A0A0K2SNW3_LIMPI|nr:flagellar export chaperone FliS [Limnochorda pilosa]BAS28791.1 flagellar biosynthesis protein FliS [Limnochorda pilosa]
MSFRITAGAEGYQAYRRTQIETAPPEQLILMLYDGAIRFGRSARRAIEVGDRQKAHHDLTRAQDVISELIGSLDMAAGGEIAANLHELYRYLYQRLVQANVGKKVEPIDEVIHLVSELREGWYEGVVQGKGQPARDERAGG